MKRFILFITCVLFMHVTFAQIGIGTTSPNDNAILDVYSTNKGLLIPRLTLTSTTSFSPLSAHVAGMLVYNTATVGDVTPGFYYNTGSAWSRVSAGTIDITVDANSNHLSSDALDSLTTGTDNLIFGEFAGGGVKTADRNVIIGDGTLTFSTSIDDDNVLFGTSVGVSSTIGRRNILMGLNTAYNGIVGNENIAIGFAAARGTIGSNNIGLGARALHSHEDPSSKVFGDNNIGIGPLAGRGAGGGSYNIFMGYFSGSGAWVGSDNIFIGQRTGRTGGNSSSGWATEQTIGDNNTILGANAFNGERALGDNNLLLGAETDTDGDTDSATVADNYSNSVALGYQATITADNQIVIGRTANDIIDLNANSINTGGDVLPDTDNSHTLGSATNRWTEVYAANGTINTSDKRLKKNILKLDYGLSEILRLNPVSYQWKTNDNGTRLGFIAQDLQKVLPEVVTVSEDKDKRLGVRYSELIPVLTKALQEQQALIESLKTQNNTLSSEVTKSTADIEELKSELQLLKEHILGTSAEVSVLNK